jgi:hypothetical protein
LKPLDSSAGQSFEDCCCIVAAIEANARYGHHHQLAPIERAAVLKDFAKLREKLGVAGDLRQGRDEQRSSEQILTPK